MLQPQVGVGIIVEKDNQVLLLRRKSKLGDGKWSPPGGYLDFGETPEECAMREAREETGINVTSVSFIGITNDLFEDNEKHFITIWMKANSFEGTPYINAAYEMTDLQWFDWTDLPNNLFEPFKKVVQDQIYTS